jgi:hypothetical protein
MFRKNYEDSRLLLRYAIHQASKDTLLVVVDEASSF